MKKKLISMICILALVFTSVIPASAMDTPAGGEIKPVSVSQLHINPLYEDVIDEAALRAELAEAAQYAVQPLDDITYYSDDEKIAEILRQAMVNRQESVTIGYASNANYTQEDHDAILDLVFVETDSPKEGDYLRFQYGGCGADGGGYIQNGVYYLTLVYSISYYTTAEQETAMDAAVESVLQNLGITWYMNDYDKVCKIYDYICSHVTYDNTNLNDPEYKLKYTAYAALINGTAVCQGYANLFYRLAKEADLSPRIISGVQTTSGGGHAWNIVKLGDWYYNLDATWDSAYVEAGRPYAYYLKGWTTFDNHTFDAAYTTEAFLSAYPMSTEAYVPGSGQETQKDISKAAASLSEDTFVYNGNPHAPEVMIEGLEYGVDYEVDYVNNLNAGQAEAIARGIGNYCGEISLPFTIEPKDISGIKVSLDKEVYRYSGTPVQPLVDAGDLVEGKDFDLSYSNNNGIGTGVVTLIGKGNFTGTMTVEFQILECEHQWDNGIVTLEPNCAREGIKSYICKLCQGEKTEAIPVNGSHDMSGWVVEKAATCSESGLQAKTCQNGCGHREEEVLPATGNHIFGAWVETEPAACEKPGKAERTCTGCGTEETKTLAALTHNPVEDAAVAPTCVKTGLTAGSHCSICGEILTAQKETAVDPNNHDMGQWKTEKAATCGEAGLQVKTCQNGCGHREEEVLPATGKHTFGAWVEIEPAACEKTGKAVRNCTGCGTEESKLLDALTHNPVEDAAVAPTCVKPGLTAGSHCIRCGEPIVEQKEVAIDKDNHQMSSWVVEKAATCGEAGLQVKTCQNGCGHREEEVLPATGKHTFGAWVEIEPAACEKTGKAERTCAGCGTEETKTLAALTHNPVEDAAVAPTCVKPGLTAGSHCSICGEILTAQKETAVDPNNHDMGQWKTEKPATCGEPGLKVRTCQNGCGHREEITPLAEHSFTKYVSNEDATCTEDGTKTAQCDNCTATRTVTDTDSAKGHTEEKDIKKASRTADGMILTTCFVCGDTLKTEVIPAIETVKLSYTKKPYTGSYISAPKLTVTDREGNAITPSSISGLVNKKSVGRYKVTVSFKDDYYDDSVELFFTIVPKKVSSAAANLNSADATGGYNDIKFTWKKSTGATGYLVYYKKASASKWSAAVSTTKTSYTKKNLAAGTKYTFKVVPYYKESGKTTKYYDTAQYRTASTTTLKKVTGVKAAKSGTKVKVSWTNIAGETGYQISKMTKKSATQKTPTTVKSTTAKSKLVTATKGKTYYYKVRAYKVVDGKKVYGPWSEVKAFKRK